MNMSDEKRTRERFPLKQVIELKTGDGLVIPSKGINISESGILCRAEKEMAPGTGVTFQLIIPGEKSDITVECEGVILRCTDNKGEFDVVIDLTDRDCME